MTSVAVALLLLLTMLSAQTRAAGRSPEPGLFAGHGSAVRTKSETKTQTPQSVANAPALHKLAVGETVRVSIRDGEPQSVGVTLAAGQYAQVIFLWRGFDLKVTVTAPGGLAAGVPPVPVQAPGPVSVSVVAETAGEYRFEVRPLETLKVSGDFEARLAAVRLPTAADELRRRAERALAEGISPDAPVSKEKIGEALRLWREAEDALGQSAALHALAESNHLQNLTAAVEQYEAAIALRRQLNDARAEAHILVDVGNAYRKHSAQEKALACYERALALSREAGDRTGESRALYYIGLALARAGEHRESVRYLEQALAIQSADGDRPREASTLNVLGGVSDRLGDYDAAQAFYQRAHRIRLELDDRIVGALLLNNLSTLNVTLGNWQAAKENFETTLSVYESSLGKNFTGCGGDKPEQTKKVCGYAAYTLGNLGELYNTLGDPEAALVSLEHSYSLHAGLADNRGMGTARSHMCYSKLLQAQPQEALTLCKEALSLQTQPDGLTPKVDPPMVAYTFTATGMVYDALGETAQASAYYDRASAFHLKSGDERALAITLDKAGASLARGGDAAGALEKFDRALSLWRGIKDRDGEALTLYQVARAERGRGKLVEAHASISKALDIVESLRGNVSAQRLRASYFAQKLDYYELAVDLKMQLAKAGGRGIAAPAELVAEALQTSERARARVLLDILSQARIEPRRAGSDPKLDELLRTHEELQRRLNHQAALHTRLLAEKMPLEQLASVEKEIAQLAAKYEDVDAQVRERNPRYAGLTKPQPLGVAEIQRELLDDETLLLEYALGEERSYLWVVARSGIKSFELRKRAEIEESARRIVDILRDEQRRPGEAAQTHEARLARLESRFRGEAALLSEMVLAPAAAELGNRRLLIVAAGGLQQVPFAALPSPDAARGSKQMRVLNAAANSADDVPPVLGEEHEIINLPSASTLAALRSEAKGRRTPPKVVTVLADPIFDRDDPRLQVALKTRPGQVASARSPRAWDDVVRSFGMNLSRLLSSRKEANDIVAAAPAGMATAALDFEASRSTATSSQLGQYRIVHFATHGVFNDRQPELSGVVLSLFDEHGRPREDGFLRLHDIYNLNLPVDMVVLSACQTGLGKQVRGEGLIGLTRGFMYAGAPRVVASLWKVDDKATAELMKLFYGYMLRDGMTPPAALRQAQMSLRRQRRWSIPYYWAGFILQGEWK